MTITESHNTEELKAALEQLKSYISRIQHDLNNPLSVVSGNVELLKELAIALNVYADVEDPLEDMGAALDKLTEQVDRLMVIRSMLSNFSEKL
jgi:signal transduction histidine kinase